MLSNLPKVAQLISNIAEIQNQIDMCFNDCISVIGTMGSTWCSLVGIFLLIQVRRLSYREVKQFTQSHLACK